MGVYFGCLLVLFKVILKVT